nr:hypothetical protein [Lachnospiraceae bacterium]
FGWDKLEDHKKLPIMQKLASKLNEIYNYKESDEQEVNRENKIKLFTDLNDVLKQVSVAFKDQMTHQKLDRTADQISNVFEGLISNLQNEAVNDDQNEIHQQNVPLNEEQIKLQIKKDTELLRNTNGTQQSKFVLGFENSLELRERLAKNGWAENEINNIETIYTKVLGDANNVDTRHSYAQDWRSIDAEKSLKCREKLIGTLDTLYDTSLIDEYGFENTAQKELLKTEINDVLEEVRRAFGPESDKLPFLNANALKDSFITLKDIPGIENNDPNASDIPGPEPENPGNNPISEEQAQKNVENLNSYYNRIKGNEHKLDFLANLQVNIANAGDQVNNYISQAEINKFEELKKDFLHPTKVTDNGKKVFKENTFKALLKSMASQMAQIEYKAGKEVYDKELALLLDVDNEEEDITDIAKLNVKAESYNVMKGEGLVALLKEGFTYVPEEKKAEYEAFFSNELRNERFIRSRFLNEEDKKYMDYGKQFFLSDGIHINEASINEAGLDKNTLIQNRTKARDQFRKDFGFNYKYREKAVYTDNELNNEKFDLISRKFDSINDDKEKLEFLSINALRGDETKFHLLHDKEKGQLEECAKQLFNIKDEYGQFQYDDIAEMMKQCVEHYADLNNKGFTAEAEAFKTLIGDSCDEYISVEDVIMIKRILGIDGVSGFKECLDSLAEKKVDISKNKDEANINKKELNEQIHDRVMNGLNDIRDDKLLELNVDTLNALSNVYDQFNGAQRFLHWNSTEYKNLNSALKEADTLLKTRNNANELSKEEQAKLKNIYRKISRNAEKYLAGKGSKRSTEMGEDRLKAAMSALSIVDPGKMKSIIEANHTADLKKLRASNKTVEEAGVKQISLKELKDRSKHNRQAIKNIKKVRPNRNRAPQKEEQKLIKL